MTTVGPISPSTHSGAYLTGFTTSANFPATPGAFDTTFNAGLRDAFLTKLDATGATLIYSTYVGAGGSETGLGIVVDSLGNAYVTGNTDATTFPTTPGAFDRTRAGNVDGFVAKFGNQAPSAAADAATTDEDNPTTISVLDNDTDPDGDQLTLVAVAQERTVRCRSTPTTR